MFSSIHRKIGDIGTSGKMKNENYKAGNIETRKGEKRIQRHPKTGRPLTGMRANPTSIRLIHSNIDGDREGWGSPTWAQNAAGPTQEVFFAVRHSEHCPSGSVAWVTSGFFLRYMCQKNRILHRFFPNLYRTSQPICFVNFEFFMTHFSLSHFLAPFPFL